MKTVITRPYEVLVRYRNGIISGAHVGFEDVIMEDGKEIGSHQSPVVSIAVGEAQGFPLKDILDQIHIDALKGRETALEAKKQVEEELATTREELATLRIAVEQAAQKA